MQMMGSLVFHVNVFLLGSSRPRSKEINSQIKRWYKWVGRTLHNTSTWAISELICLWANGVDLQLQHSHWIFHVRAWNTYPISIPTTYFQSISTGMSNGNPVLRQPENKMQNKLLCVDTLIHSELVNVKCPAPFYQVRNKSERFKWHYQLFRQCLWK